MLKFELLVLLCIVAATSAGIQSCEEMGWNRARPSICVNSPCPAGYEKPTVNSTGCPEDTNCCIFEGISCQSQGNGINPGVCLNVNYCPSGQRNVEWDNGCPKDYKCCVEAGLSCADQAYRYRPWLCIQGFCPGELGYRSVFWDTGCPSNYHRCCI